ncbi:MAG: hypothetical protein H6737_23690 [Alphaproteobacteria bacterium]|nr:hypothetical protein [Alphaproteobacteria bacterium]
MPIRFLVALLTGCAADDLADTSPIELQGEVPSDLTAAELDGLTQDFLASGAAFGVVVDPTTGDVASFANLDRSDNSADFSQIGAATCLDCGGANATCTGPAGFTRQIQVPLQRNTGSGAVDVVYNGSSNWSPTGQSCNGAACPDPDVDATGGPAALDVDLLGSLNTCSSFGVFFDTDDTVAAPTWPATTRLLACQRNGTGLQTYDDGGLVHLGSITVTLAGVTVVGCNGLAYDPTEDSLWGVYRDDVAARHLVRVDESTGVLTLVGTLSDRIASIAVDVDGVLYGDIGDGGTNANQLVVIDKTNATTTSIFQFTGGNDGEAIAYDPRDHSILRLSGRLGGNVVQKFDIATRTGTSPEVPSFLTANANEEALGVTWNNTQFTYTNLDGEFGEVGGGPGAFTLSIIEPSTGTPRGIAAVP